MYRVQHYHVYRHRQSKRGISEVIAVVLLVVIAIALAVSLYFMAGKFMNTGTTVSVSNALVQNTYTNNGADEVIVLSSKVTSQTNKQLNLSSANFIVTLSNGQTVPVTITIPSLSGNNGNIQIKLLNPSSISINPGSSQTFEFSITAPASAGISSITIQYTFKTPSGNLITVSSNSLSVSG